MAWARFTSPVRRGGGGNSSESVGIRMKKVLKQFRHLLEYAVVLSFYGLIRILPRSGVRVLAHICAWCMARMPSAYKICEANIRVAFPEWDAARVHAVAKAGLFNISLNFLEFVWMTGKPRRIERVCVLPEPVKAELEDYVARGVRIIFVNPHLGSWEASGLMAPYYADVRMVAIAKPVRNPYINRLLNRGNREKERGLRIVFARGAMRAAVKALREGLSIGTLIDQNTRVRDGGEFVHFFGLPAPSSKAPAVLMRYCKTNHIPAVIVYGTSVRDENNRIVAHSATLSRPFEEYPDDTAVIEELMRLSERYIRQYPEQYVWFYKRFSYIPRDADDALRQRYPWYSEVASPSFYNATLRRRKGQ